MKMCMWFKTFDLTIFDGVIAHADLNFAKIFQPVFCSYAKMGFLPKQSPKSRLVLDFGGCFGRGKKPQFHMHNQINILHIIFSTHILSTS